MLSKKCCKDCPEEEITMEYLYVLPEVIENSGEINITKWRAFLKGKTNIVFKPRFNSNWNIEQIVANYTPPSWYDLFNNNQALLKTISSRLKNFDDIFPEKENIFRVFHDCPLYAVKVVIIGQDPYHSMYRGKPNAQGLAFSVPDSHKTPPSLKNIKEELKNEGFSVQIGKNDLSKWVSQGVFLYNTALTVEKGNANSHKSIWEAFSEIVIEFISLSNPTTIFMLWGRQAQMLKKFIKSGEILTSSHPSGFSAHRGFIGCNHFRKCNEYLESLGKKPIDWSI